MSKLKNTRVSSEAPASIAPTEEKITRPFRYRASDEDLAELRRRIQATRWPDKELVSDQSQGVQLETMRALARYWADEYDWRKCEARLNALPNFITEIDGLDIHFIHVKSKHANALPLIVTHGWPGSIVEQFKIIDPLTNPTAHGATESDAFDIVIPSIPGFGFSAKPTVTGWDPVRIANAWIELMRRLGYKKFVAQGGDWGALITDRMGVLAPPELLGIHTNLPQAVPEEIAKASLVGAPAPGGLTDEEKRAYDRLALFFTKGLGYAVEMGNRPQTLYGLADSPIALASWILDHDQLSYEMIARVFAGKTEGMTRDDVLDNVTLFWLTNTGISAGRIYWENKLSFVTPNGVKVPVAVSAFPDELYQLPKSWAERAYPKLVYYNKPPKGGHFAAWEQPQLLCGDIRAGFRTLRT